MESRLNGASAPRRSDLEPPNRSPKPAASRLLRLPEDPSTESELMVLEDRDPKSKLEEGLGGGAMGADFPLGLKPKSEAKRLSKSFMVDCYEIGSGKLRLKGEREEGGRGI